MEHQLNLFPSMDPSDTAELFPSRESNAVDEMFAVSHGFRSSQGYLELLRFICRFPNYSPFNGLLLFMQNPNITNVATAGTWLRQYQREIKTGARPWLILAPMSPVRFVFDVADTQGETVPDEAMSPKKRIHELSADMMDNTRHNGTLSGVFTRDLQLAPQTTSNLIPVSQEASERVEELGIEPESRMNYLILLNETHPLENQYAGLVHELAKVFCGHSGINANAWWLDRKDISEQKKEIEAESVAFLVCRRIGLGRCAQQFLSKYRNQDIKMPVVGFAAVLNATSYIEDMGKSRWKKPKRQGRS